MDTKRLCKTFTLICALMCAGVLIFAQNLNPEQQAKVEKAIKSSVKKAKKEKKNKKKKTGEEVKENKKNPACFKQIPARQQELFDQLLSALVQKADLLTHVDRCFALPPDYKPNDLELIPTGKKTQLYFDEVEGEQDRVSARREEVEAGIELRREVLGFRTYESD